MGTGIVTVFTQKLEKERKMILKKKKKGRKEREIR
jgi:hypothetical protein